MRDHRVSTATALRGFPGAVPGSVEYYEDLDEEEDEKPYDAAEAQSQRSEAREVFEAFGLDYRGYSHRGANARVGDARTGGPPVENERAMRKLLALDPPVGRKRRFLPLSRGGCAGVPRPCPHVGCRHHVYLDVQTQNSISPNLQRNFDGSPEDVPADYSCSLDVADRGGLILEGVGVVLGVTRERVRQIEAKALEKLRKRFERLRLREDLEG